jgi:hypothetical protein
LAQSRVQVLQLPAMEQAVAHLFHHRNFDCDSFQVSRHCEESASRRIDEAISCLIENPLFSDHLFTTTIGALPAPLKPRKLWIVLVACP